MQNASLEGACDDDATLKRSILHSVLIEPQMINPQDIKIEEDVVTQLLRESSASHQRPETCHRPELASKLTAGRPRGRSRTKHARRRLPARVPLNARADERLDSSTPPIVTVSQEHPYWRGISQTLQPLLPKPVVTTTSQKCLCGKSISRQNLQPLLPKPVVTSGAAFQSSPSVFLPQQLLAVASDQMGGVLSNASPPSLHSVTLCTSGNDLMNGITVRVVIDNAEHQMQQPLSISQQQLQSLVQSDSVGTHPSNSFTTAAANQTSGVMSSAPPAMHSVTLGPPAGNNGLASGMPVEVPSTDIADDAPPDPYSAHSAIERFYWMSINSRIAELGEIIAGKGSELTRQTVLLKAIEHIRQLRAENQRLKEENKTLRLALHE